MTWGSLDLWWEQDRALHGGDHLKLCLIEMVGRVKFGGGVNWGYPENWVCRQARIYNFWWVKVRLFSRYSWFKEILISLSVAKSSWNCSPSGVSDSILVFIYFIWEWGCLIIFSVGRGGWVGGVLILISVWGGLSNSILRLGRFSDSILRRKGDSTLSRLRAGIHTRVSYCGLLYGTRMSL